MTLGNQGGWLYGDSNGFDGAQVAAQFGKVNVAVGYGQFNTGTMDWTDYGHNPAETGRSVDLIANQDVFYAKADADLGAFDLYANYYTNTESHADVDFDIWGVGLNVPVGDFRVFGEYWNNTSAPDIVEDSAWNAGIGYGKKDLKKPGSWQLDVAYNEVGAGVYLGGTGLQTDILKPLWKAADRTEWADGEWDYKGINEVDFWNAIAEVTLMQNMYLHAEYAFAADADQGEDPDDTWTVSLNYVF